MRARTVDLAMYFQALPMLLRRPSILAAPLLAAVIGVLLTLLAQWMTDPVGGVGAGLYMMIAQIVYLMAFAVAVIQASNLWRGRKGTFDDAWDDARRKLGGIALAAIGFQFLTYVAGLVGGLLDGLLGGYASLVATAVAAFLLIYMIPAAAIGGMPGQLSVTASYRGVRANLAAAIILAIVWFVLTRIVPNLVIVQIAEHWGGATQFSLAIIEAAIVAIINGYLAFPFAKQYDDVAFRGLW